MKEIKARYPISTSVNEELKNRLVALKKERFTIPQILVAGAVYLEKKLKVNLKG